MSSPPLTLESILSTLATKSLGRPLHLHHELCSTNSEALSLAQAGAAHGTVVVADSQSSGRGRYTRSWFSPPGTNVYCSIIVRGTGSGITLSQWLSWIPLATALAVSEAVQCIAAVPIFLKWPNDVLLDDRKVGGILCESALQWAADPVVVIGIGLNVNLKREAFPDEFRPTAISLLEISRRPIDRNRLVAQLLFDLEETLEELRSHGPARLRQAYVSRCRTIGRRVHILLGPEQELIGTAEAISADGALQVRALPSAHAAQQPPLIDIRAADVTHLRE